MNMPDIAKFLVEAGRCAPSADNTQPWCFRCEGNELVLRYDAMRLEGATFPVGHPATLIAMGAVIENILQACQALGLRPKYICQIPESEPYEFFRISLEDKPENGVAENIPLFKRHTNRLPFRTDSLPQEILNFLHTQREGAAHLQVIDARNEICKISKLVRQASQVRFQTREIHDWFSRSLRFGRKEVEGGDGLDVATFGLPPGGKLLLRTITTSWRNMSRFNMLGGHKLLAGIEAASITKAGAIIALIGSRQAAGAMEAGKLMERVWIALNEAGFGVQPYYVIPDQLARLEMGNVPLSLQERVEELKQHAAQAFNLGEECLYMLLRVGTPKDAPVRSLRLPVERVFFDR